MMEMKKNEDDDDNHAERKGSRFQEAAESRDVIDNLRVEARGQMPLNLMGKSTIYM